MSGHGQYRATVVVRAQGALRPATMRCCDNTVHSSPDAAGRCGARRLRSVLATATSRRHAVLAPVHAAYTVEEFSTGTAGWTAVTW